MNIREDCVDPQRGEMGKNIPKTGNTNKIE